MNENNFDIEFRNPYIVVIGAGVIGLTTAMILSDAGYKVRIITKEGPLETVSATAAAFWWPFHVEGIPSVCARSSLAAFERLANRHGTGVTIVDGVEYFESHSDFSKWRSRSWWRMIPSLACRDVEQDDLPVGFVHGIRFRTPVIRMPTYLRWLEGEIQRRGIEVHRQQLNSVNEVSECGLIVNTTGLGAAQLLPDTGMYALRGQVVRTRPIPALEGRLVFMTTGPYEDEPMYALDRVDDAIIGGTTDLVPLGQVHLPDLAVASRILERASRLVPELSDLKSEDILEHRVGLRPCRKGGVRLGLEEHRFRVPVIHAYGHGGGGVTYSYGTAEEVLRLADAVYLRAH